MGLKHCDKITLVQELLLQALKDGTFKKNFRNKMHSKWTNKHKSDIWKNIDEQVRNNSFV